MEVGDQWNRVNNSSTCHSQVPYFPCIFKISSFYCALHSFSATRADLKLCALWNKANIIKCDYRVTHVIDVVFEAELHD